MKFHSYLKRKSSGIEWLGDVPENWCIRRIRYCAELNPSKGETASLPRNTDVSFLPMEAIGDDGTIDAHRIKPICEVETGYTYFREGDLTIAKITPCFENGKGALMAGLKNGVGFGTTELIVIRANQKAQAGFLQWLFQSAPFRKIGEGFMYGAGGQKRVPDDFVRNFKMAWPSIADQEFISIFLDRETTKIDTLIAKQEKLIDLLKEKRQAVISHAVTKGLDPTVPMKSSGVEWLGDVPEHWEIRKLSAVSTKITNGYVGPTRDILVDEGVRYLQSLHIKRNSIRFNTPYYVREEWSTDHAKSVLELGDVLIVQTGDIGQVAVVTQDFVGCNCHALIIVAPLQSAIHGEWLSWTLNSDYGYHKLLSIQTGALHPHLNCGNVKDIYIPLPPKEVQREIAEYISKELKRFDTLIVRAQQAIALQREHRTALISAAVTGKIDVRETTSELQQAA